MIGGHHLYMLSKTRFAIKSSRLKSVFFFDSMEGAAAALIELGVRETQTESDIDDAIAHMFAHEHNHAEFGILEGRFTVSDYIENLTEDSLK